MGGYKSYASIILCYSQCYVNGVKFVAWDRDRNMKTRNSGVLVEDGHATYYGVIRNIVQLQYTNGMPVVLFDCIWFNTDPIERGSTKRDYGLLSVDTSTSWYEEWSYCLATTTRQVFYLDDLKPVIVGRWSMLLRIEEPTVSAPLQNMTKVVVTHTLHLDRHSVPLKKMTLIKSTCPYTFQMIFNL
ncbi:hypothetical protein QQ045_029673 [Rhodiola kirilowii]